MKKVGLIIAICGAATFVSCKKCQECHYDKGEEEVEIGEYCEDELENVEKNGYTVGDSVYTVHCEEHE